MCQRGKNHKVPLMMMTAASAATASAPTPPAVWAVVWVVDVSQKRTVAFQTHSMSFFPISCPHTKFHSNRTNNIEFKDFRQCLALVGRSGQ